MKNYPLLTVNNKNRFYHWRNNYVTPLLNQVKDLSYYSYFMEPPYREFLQTLTPSMDPNDYEIYNNIIVEDTFNFDKMPVHSSVQLTSEMTVTWTKSGETKRKTLPSGTWVVSEARDEGISSLITDFDNYIYMPGGYGSFYVLTDILYNETTSNYDLIFSYLRNAGEIYGYTPKSNLIFSTTRFVLNPDIMPLQYEQKGKTIHSANLGTYINTGTFVEWYTLVGTPMHFSFTSNTESEINNVTSIRYGEEVILDETHDINLEEANTHSYTINSKHNDVSAFYVDFI